MTTLELARQNYLRPNGLGGYVIRQSDLSSWSRCNLQKFYYDRANADPEAPQPSSLSATVYGTVVHLALMIGEQAIHEGQDYDDAVALAIRTFEHYWEPNHLVELGERITDWLPRQTYGGLRERGRIAIKDYFRLRKTDEAWLLGLEYQFAVPVRIGDVTHTLSGTIDRLSIRKAARKPYLSVDDYKTGKQPIALRHNMQGSAYAYATTKDEFWFGWKDSGMGELATFSVPVIVEIETMLRSWGYRLTEGSDDQHLPMASRRFRWINLQDIKYADGGWRNERDYARLHLAIDAYVRACEAGIYSVSQSGDVCTYCPFRKDCAGVGLPDIEAGAP